MDPSGIHHFWGLSPALDLVALAAAAQARAHHPDREAPRDAVDDDDAPPLRFLLVQPGDVRHVLKTVSERHRRGSTRRMEFYVYEREPELLAAHVLLLGVALDGSLPLRQRAQVWLELFGNLFVQARTAAFVAALRAALLHAVDVGSSVPPARAAPFAAALHSALDVSQLKHKERDALEEAIERLCATFGSEAAAPTAPASTTASARVGGHDMESLWCQRLRHHYGARFDARDALAEWDHGQAVLPVAGIIHHKQFVNWRRTGIAFEFGDQQYTVGNAARLSFARGTERSTAALAGRTLAVTASVTRRGYWGDVVASPFHAVGTAADVGPDGACDCTCGRVSTGRAAPSESPTQQATACSCGRALAPLQQSQPRLPLAAGLFAVVNRRRGGEQWRHNAGEVALFNLTAWLGALEAEGGVEADGAGSGTAAPRQRRRRRFVMARPDDVLSCAWVDDAPADDTGAAAADAGAPVPGCADTPARARDSSVPAVTPSPLSCGPATSTARSVGGDSDGSLSPPAPAPIPSSLAPPAPPPTPLPSLRGVRVILLTGGEPCAALPRAGAAAAGGGGVGEDAAGAAPLAASAAASPTLLQRLLRRHVPAGSPDVNSLLHFDCMCLSIASAHALGDAQLPRLANSTAGAAVVVETARNVPTLPAATRLAFTDTLLRLGGRAGGVLLGSDWAVGGGARSVGTVFNFKRGGGGGDGEGVCNCSCAADAAAEGVAAASPMPLRPHSFAPGDTAGVSTCSAADRGPRVAAASTPLLAALVTAAGAEVACVPTLDAAATACAAHTAGHIVGLPTHDVRGGDAPLPEALVWALPPGPARDGEAPSRLLAAVAAAFVRCEPPRHQ